MESYASRNRPLRHRQPLTDTTNWVNNQTPLRPSQAQPSSPTSNLPHHESLKPGGTLQARNNPSSPLAAAVNNRVSAISNEDKRSTNRDSQITISTNTSDKIRPRKTHIGPWQMGKTIGKGSSGRVRRARHCLTGKDAAIKIVSKSVAAKLRTTSLAQMEHLLSADDQRKRPIPFGIEREVIIMKLIEHPNVISLYDVWENRGELYLVLEYIEGGELFDHISKNGTLPEHEAIRIFRQIIAGLSYCHRFNICHRDLKPENLLLDKNRNVKIVDFGMAVLQPPNMALETSCGSPHYAAPEVIRAEQYRGDRADIWSCGVILYAMLAGCLPFDSAGDWSDVVRAVLLGRYEFPKEMSAYAQDLIYRMLQLEPRKRIPIKQMWNHPLLQRYEHLDSPDSDGRSYIGPLPALTVIDCGSPIKDRRDLDVELLQNLQNLYHGINEDELVQKLLSDDHERVLYTKLVNYREEQLEDYQGPTIEYSLSDYHHESKYEEPPPMPQPSSTRASLQQSRLQHGQAQSRYSILLEETPQRSMSVQRPPSSSHNRPKPIIQRHSSAAETEGSYDPYRSSRARFHKPHTDRTRITVLRDLSNRNSGGRQSTSSLNRRVPSKASSQRPSPLPAQDNDEFSIVSSPPATYSSQLARMRNQRRLSRASSRHTFASSTGTRVVRKSASYRRGVSFTHFRKRSASADIPSQSLRYSSSLAPEKGQSLQQRASSNPLPTVPDSPRRTPSPDLLVPLVRSRKHVPISDVEAERRLRIASQYWKEDTRKVSKELENFCDEAFNRASVASSVPTTATATTDHKSIGTPATSHSIHNNLPMPSVAVRRVAKSSNMRAYEDRPLPQPPREENLGSFTQRELAKTRDILLKRAADSDMSPGYLDEVIAHLDRLMQPSAVRLEEATRRAASAPGPRSPGIPPNKDTFERFLESRDVAFRSASEPTAQSPRKRPRHADTIRVVDDREQKPVISPVKPLTIRKRSDASTPSTETLRKRASKEQLLQPSDSRQYDRFHSGERRSAGLNLLDKSLAPIEEHAVDPENGEQKSRTVTKKKSWFFRGHQANKSQDNEKMPPPPLPMKESIQQDFQNSGARKETPAWKRASDPTSETSQDSEGKKGGMTGKARLLKLFGRKDLKTKWSSQELKVGQWRPGSFLLCKRSDILTFSRLTEYDLEDDASFCSTSTTSHQPYLMSGGLQTRSTTSVARQRDKQQPLNDKSSLSVPQEIVGRKIQPRHQNWLQKFLRIKPAVTVLPFHVSRVRARKEMVSLLKEWKRYGMRDIVEDKVAGRVWARVGEKNSLHIRPVSLAIETFTVLERGRKANLALARFTQEKGAKSSFERVVKTMEKVLGGRGVLVEDRRKAEGMMGVLAV
ncbi:MAG: hypothetical protein Q9224_000357 [Gallowayella concinna]